MHKIIFCRQQQQPALPKENNEHEERDDIFANVIVAPLLIIAVDEVLSGLGGSWRDNDGGGIAAELRHREALERVVQRVQPVHEQPEGGKALLTNHEAREQGQQGRCQPHHHCVHNEYKTTRTTR
jgi:hypothetical protein